MTSPIPKEYSTQSPGGLAAYRVHHNGTEAYVVFSCIIDHCILAA